MVRGLIKIGKVIGRLVYYVIKQRVHIEVLEQEVKRLRIENELYKRARDNQSVSTESSTDVNTALSKSSESSE